MKRIPIKHKDNSSYVYDVELFKTIIKSWMSAHKWTKDQALDEWFSINAEGDKR